jgi:hypothetical protein
MKKKEIHNNLAQEHLDEFNKKYSEVLDRLLKSGAVSESNAIGRNLYQIVLLLTAEELQWNQGGTEYEEMVDNLRQI